MHLQTSRTVRPGFRPVLAAFIVWGLAMMALPTSSPAQPKPSQAAPDEAAPVEQKALTEKQIEGLLAGQKDIAAVAAKLPESDADKPDPKAQAALDGAVKKYGFATYADYDAVVSNVALVMSGFDPETKSFIGPDAVLKKEIAEVKADKEMPAADKKKALEELNASLKTASSIQFPDNIKLVGKYYDKLSAIMQQDE